MGKYNPIKQFARRSENCGPLNITLTVQGGNHGHFAGGVFDRHCFFIATLNIGKFSSGTAGQQASGGDADRTQHTDCRMSAMGNEGARGDCAAVLRWASHGHLRY